ncbi:hypothetical protein OROHE_016706 [Orobanche hederae]
MANRENLGKIANEENPVKPKSGNTENLAKIADEGFAIIDEIYYRKKRQENQVHEHPSPKSPPIMKDFGKPKAIDCNETAKRYGGVIIKEVLRKDRI